MPVQPNPFISVIMNCYNGDKYLREAIDSVFSQTYKNWELIFWDNQSTDRSSEICKSYNDPRIRYFYSPRHTTLGEARNLAVYQAKGSWVAFLDSDDLWLPNKLFQQVSIIEEEEKRGSNLGLIYGRTVFFSQDGDIKTYFNRYSRRPLPEKRLLERLFTQGDFIVLSSLVVQKSAYLRAGGIPNDYQTAEELFLIAAILESYQARAVQNVCCKYRVHSSNLSQSLKLEACEECIRIINTWISKLDPQVQNRIRRTQLALLHTEAAINLAKRQKWADAINRFKFNGSWYYFLRISLKESIGWAILSIKQNFMKLFPF